MKKYVIRLDDACEFRHVENWDRMESLLDQYAVKPLVGIIPHCEDPKLMQYRPDSDFWLRVGAWDEKGWSFALHGYDHVYRWPSGGLNPVNRKSEFAGAPLELQKQKIADGVRILREHALSPRVFFAPAHTYDMNTIRALRDCSDIRIISDTFASKPYSEHGMTFVPVQSGKPRELPFPVVTYCLHPNTMQEADFVALEEFIRLHRHSFVAFFDVVAAGKLSVFDRILRKSYLLARKLR